MSGRRICLAAMTCAAVFAVWSSCPLLAKSAARHTPNSGWAKTDLPADPTILFGTLPNGMRYAIQKNTTPARQVSFRLRIAAGSLDETDSEEGIAHFIEHMAFRGSQHFPDGEAFKTLESLGLSVGADLNAYTYANRTVFKFDLPANDDATLDKALLLTRDIADGLTFDPASVASERAVVLAEARLDDVPAFHESQANLAAALGARLADALTPIGKREAVENASAAELRQFYSTYYRPERALLIVVGDIDPKAMEAKIKAGFSSWKDAAPFVAPPEYHVTHATAPYFTMFSQPGADNVIALTWAAPFDASADTLAWEQRGYLRQIGMGILRLRLSNIQHSATPPFLAGTAAHSRTSGVADVTSLGVSYAPGKALEALQAAHAAYDDIVRNGVQQSEVEQAVKNRRAELQTWISVADTTPTPRRASMILEGTEDDGVYTSAKEDLAVFESVAANLTADRVTAELRTLFGANGPSVFVASPVPLDGGENAVAAAFAKVTATPVAAAESAKPWPYGDFGQPGTVVSRKTIDDLGATFVTFANGVRATIKPTKFAGGQIAVSVRFGDGWMALPKNRKSPTWALASAFTSGGLGKMDIADLQKTEAGKVLQVGFGIEPDAFALSATTRPEDYATQLQLLAAYMEDPAWRPQAFAQAQSSMLNYLDRARNSPGSTFQLLGVPLQHDNDPRTEPPTADEVRATHLEDVKALLQSAVANSPIEILVVGDISIDDAIKGIQATFAALPKRTTRESPLVGDERLPKPDAEPVVFRHQGGSDQALAYISWPTKGYFPDMQGPRTLRMLQLIMDQRLFDELRTHEGITYTPQTAEVASMLTTTFGYVSISANVPPSKIPNVYAAIAKVAADLKSTAVTPTELERARLPWVDDRKHALETNQYWVGSLSGAQEDPRMLEYIRSTLPDLLQVTPADIQRAAQTYLADNKALKIVVVPEGYAMPAADR
jgi:zinc protease